MNRLFRTPNGGRASYVALAVFAVAYLAALALVVAPGLILPSGAMP